jgi:hypothetical protein
MPWLAFVDIVVDMYQMQELQILLDAPPYLRSGR